MFITKEEAQKLSESYREGLYDRISMFLNNLARSGYVGGTYQLADMEIPDDKIVSELQKAGWTVVLDKETKVVTIS